MPLFKAGDEEVDRNYSRIALGSCVAKGRISKFSENHILTEGQGGFRPGKVCADQVLVLRNVCDIMCHKETDIFGISGFKQIRYYVEKRIVDEDERVQGSGRICQCMQKLV